MTATVANASSEPADARAAALPTQQLWQVPTFLLGLVLLGGTGLLHHCGRGPTCWSVREVAAARQLLTKPDGNVESAMTLLNKVLEQGDLPAEQRGEVSFLLGTGQLRLADRAEPNQASLLYQSAREHLEQAQRSGVPARDEGTLQYRLAKVAFHTGDDPDKVVQRLAGSIDQAEDWEKADAYRLLTDAYLRLPKPDYKAALTANEKLRTHIAMVPAEILDPARVTAAELMLKLQRPPEEARKTLDRITPQAPPSLQARARLLKAQSYYAEEQWQEAANLWKADLANLPEGSPQRSEILYRLGLCYRKLEQAKGAIESWELCCRSSRGTEGQAAALALAELHLEERQLELVNKRLSEAVRDVARPEDWKNQLVEAVRVREIFERACQSFRDAGQFDLAEELIGLYERVAEKDRVPLLRAEVLGDWGRTRRKLAEQLKDQDAQMREQDQARDLLCRAGAAYEKAANNVSQAEDQANLLWLAIGCYREAPENGQMMSLCDRFFKVNTRNERTGEGWYLLGEVFRRENQAGDAEYAYKKCIEYLTPFAFRARYQLAVLNLERGNLDEAETILEENLKLLREVSSPDAEAREKSTFALGDLLFKKRKYSEVVSQLELALGQFPNNPQAPRAHYQLAESYRQLAIQMNLQYLQNTNKNPGTVEHTRDQYHTYLKKAAQEFLDLAYYLDQVGPVEYLTKDERIKVPFFAADCRFNLGKYDEALQLYEALAERHANSREGLQALANTVRCLAALQQQEQLKKRLDEIQQALTGLDGPVREEWEKWLDIARKPTMPFNNLGPR